MDKRKLPLKTQKKITIVFLYLSVCIDLIIKTWLKFREHIQCWLHIVSPVSVSVGVVVVLKAVFILYISLFSVEMLSVERLHA